MFARGQKDTRTQACKTAERLAEEKTITEEGASELFAVDDPPQDLPQEVLTRGWHAPIVPTCRTR